MTQIQKDINELILNEKYFKTFHNSSFLITGSTGLIGSILIKSILTYNSKHNANITIYAHCRSENKFKYIFSDYLSSNLIPLYSDIQNINISNLNPDYVIHGASITDSKTFIQKPVETIFTTIDGTKNLLNQLKNKSIKSFVYLSSLEVYGSFQNCTELKNVSENVSGYIDTTSIRSSYSEGKRMVENICCSYASEFNMPIKVARLSQTFGAGVDYSDNRVFAQFARSVIENTDIILKTKGETVRNYCYTTDAVSGILTILSSGITGNAYNIANMNTTISIYKMAELFCSISKNINIKLDLTEDASQLGYNPIVKLQLDTTKLQSIGWTPSVDLIEMINRLITSMKELL